MKVLHVFLFIFFQVLARAFPCYYSENVIPNKEENEMLVLINLMRTHPQLFLDSVALPYIKAKKKENNSYAKSLISDLRKAKPAPALSFLPGLMNSASDHALDCGKTGRVSHTGSDGSRFTKRIERYLKWNGMAGENCHYGYDEPIDIVMDLLIDEGIEDVGHRVNMMSASFRYVGIAIRPHKVYGTNTVMDFVAGYSELSAVYKPSPSKQKSR